ncbi:MAG TPA: aldehyde dehydrogenase family protein [Thermoleophilia bacterium]|nr:aldehyde dehydrogenase family protein [Thermoleophilia bacterium]
MYIDGEWVSSPKVTEIRNPYSGEVVDTVPEATEEQVDQAVGAALQGASAMGRLTAYERSRVLLRAADLIEERVDKFARTITAEEGKPLVESRGEAARVPDLLRLSAHEGAQLRGETLPLDAEAGGRGKFGFTVRIPCGVVAAITPFNYPFLLVAHKVGPALAAGNAVVLKPASATPLTALAFTEVLIEAGLPAQGIQCLTGPGGTVGPTLVSDRRVRKVSFTGSRDVGAHIAQLAGAKRLTLELGANCPLVVMPDADLEAAATATARGGYVNAGQVCISIQRVIVDRRVYADFLDALVPAVEQIRVGDPFEEGTRLSAMVSEGEAARVFSWIEEAVSGGARLLTGGDRVGAVLSPAVVAEAGPRMRISRDELFGPAVAVTAATTLDEAIAMANDSEYGLGAGIFTRDLQAALRFAFQTGTGMVMINESPLWRADLMPYGGLKGSGIGREGPRYAIEEMTEIRTIVFHGLEA